MKQWEVSIQIAEQLEEKVDEGWARGVVEKALDAEGVLEGAEVDLVITNDKVIRELNKTYRGLDEPTDVLSFALTEEAEREDMAEAERFQFVLPPGMVQLGEVIISYETAERQARRQRVPVDHEIALLIVHGVLHLLGYDHAEKAEEDVMRAKEQLILSRVGLSRA